MGNFVFCSPRRRRGNGDGCCLSRGKVADRYAVGQPLTGGKAQRDFSRKGRIHQCRCAARFRPLLRLSVLCPRIYPQPTEKPPESLLTAFRKYYSLSLRRLIMGSKSTPIRSASSTNSFALFSRFHFRSAISLSRIYALT